MAPSLFDSAVKMHLPSSRRTPESRSPGSLRSFVYVGLAFFLTLFSCAPPKPTPLIEGPKLKNFEQVGPLTVYNRANLFDYMNGEADAYLPLGFRLLYVSLYSTEKTDSRMVLETYDMSTAEGASAILGKYSSEGGFTVPEIGDGAWSDKGIVLFRQGNFFVRLFPDPSPENQVRPTLQEMLDLARATDSVLH
jgi:hypothetical protein